MLAIFDICFFHSWTSKLKLCDFFSEKKEREKSTSLHCDFGPYRKGLFNSQEKDHPDVRKRLQV